MRWRLCRSASCALERNNVAISGAATVVLVNGGARYNLPGRVPQGSYDIEAAFPGETGVVVGTISATTPRRHESAGWMH